MPLTGKKEDSPFIVALKRSTETAYGSGSLLNEHTAQQSLNVPSRTAQHANNNTPTPTRTYRIHGLDKVELRDHCHRPRIEGVDVNARKKLIIASILCLLFMICEVVGGVLSNSLAIATDAAHLLTDFASFMISLLAIWIAGRPSTQRMSFGWYRAEVIGALASVVMIWFITAILVWLAVERIINNDFELDAKIMLITSGLAILVNIVMGFQLQHGHSHGSVMGHGHGHSHAGKKGKNKKSKKQTSEANAGTASGWTTPTTTRHKDAVAIEVTANYPKLTEAENTAATPVDAELPPPGLQTYSYQNAQKINETDVTAAAVMSETAPGAHHHGGDAGIEAVNMNVRAAFIHVLGDVVQSFGVFVAALIIYFKPEWAIADPICTFIFSIIVLFTTFTILKDAIMVLMEGTPNYMHYAEVMQIFKQIEGVERVHNLRIWALSINKVALSAHLAIRPSSDPKRILEEANKVVHKRYNFFETTIQIEEYSSSMENCQQCITPNP